jgi:NADPH:quinone reductase-like Zn-dependent oxidoreductase
MRAALVEAFGPFDAIKVKEIEAPTPMPGEVLIRVCVAGVNFADGGMVSGRAPRKQPPFVPGVEAAGIVEAVGKGVTDQRAGDRVVYWDPMPRAFGTVPGRFQVLPFAFRYRNYLFFHIYARHTPCPLLCIWA